MGVVGVVVGVGVVGLVGSGDVADRGVGVEDIVLNGTDDARPSASASASAVPRNGHPANQPARTGPVHVYDESSHAHTHTRNTPLAQVAKGFLSLSLSLFCLCLLPPPLQLEYEISGI